MNLKEALDSILESFPELLSTFAKRVKEVLGGFRNHENKYDSDNVCTPADPCMIHRAMDKYDELGGDSMVGFYHKDCGTIQPRKHGVICMSCGKTFTVGEREYMGVDIA